ncbi:MAG: cellulase family glycosylhydrolase [bacterium]
MKLVKLLFIGVILMAAQACSSVTVRESEQFVRVKGTKFYLGEKPYYFAGTNLWYGCYLGSPGETGDRERLKRELDFLSELGIKNLRICAASEESAMGRSIKPAIHKSPGVYDEDLLIGLDFLLAEMKKRDMKGVLFINNYWQWTGGMAQYNQWFSDEKLPDPDNPKEGYGMFMDYSAKFYQNEKAMELFRKYVYDIVTRQNKFTGEYYLNDPVIMAWQLANEPRPGRDVVSKPYVDYFYKWVDETAKYIHSLDPNHLVTTGSEGMVGCIHDEEVFLKTHGSKYIDYVTMHLWAKNWGWFDATKIDETYPRTESNAIDYFNQHMQLCRQLNKPITMEEFGMPRNNEEYAAGTPTNARDKYFEKLFEMVYDSAAAGAPIAGTNFWGWGGEGRPQNDEAIWNTGDPLTGDPPQEPQGLNSIFNSDVSTLEILKKHAEAMKSLSERKLP